MNRRRFLKKALVVGGIAVAAIAGLDFEFTSKLGTQSSSTQSSSTNLTLPYSAIDQDLAGKLNSLYSITAQELSKSKGILAHSDNKTFSDLASLPNQLISLQSYFDDGILTVRDGFKQLLNALEGEQKSYDDVNQAVEYVNGNSSKLSSLSPSQGIFSQISQNLNAGLKTVHDALAAGGSWDSIDLEASTSASLLALNYLNQGINFFTLAKDLFQDREFIGQWEIKNITENKVFWIWPQGGQKNVVTGSTALDWVGNSTQPIKSRERAFGRTIDVAYSVFNKILNSIIGNDGKALLDFRNSHPFSEYSPYISESLGPIAIGEIDDLESSMGSDAFDSLYLNITSGYGTYEFNVARLQMLLERCSWHPPSADKLKYILKSGESQIGNVIDFCKISTFPDDVALDYASVLEDLKFVDLAEQIIGYNVNDYSTLNPTPSYNSKTDALFNLRQLLAKIALKEEEEFTAIGIQERMPNFGDIYSTMKETKTAYAYSKVNLFLQIMNDKIVDFSRLQGSPFRFVHTNFGWDNFMDYFTHVEENGNLFANSSTVKLSDLYSPVLVPKDHFTKGVHLNNFNSDVTFYGYVGILNESFPVAYNILLTDQVRKYAPEWLVSYLTS